MKEIEKPIIQSTGLAEVFIKDMEKICPIWAWSKKKDLERKNSKW